MENNTNQDFIATELLSELKKDRKFKNILSIILLMALIITNAFWLWYTSGYDYISYQQDGEGSNIIGNMNEVIQNGTETKNTEGEKP